MSQLHSNVLFRIPSRHLAKYKEKVNLNDPVFELGLYLATYDLWKVASKNSAEDLKEKILISCLKYWVRHCTRPTPFGSFAGIFLAEIEEETRLTVQDFDENNIAVRFDMNFLTSFINQIIESDCLKEKSNYALNNSIYSSFDSFRYAEHNPTSYFSSYELSSVQKSEHLVDLVDFFGNSKRNFVEIVTFLVQKFNVHELVSREFVLNLINSQFIVNDLQLEYTGNDNLQKLINKLGTIKANNSTIEFLVELKKSLDKPKSEVFYFQNLKNKIYSKYVDLPKNKNVFQVDLYHKAHSAAIDERIIQSIVSQVRKLNILSDNHTHPDLTQFKDSFLRRFEDREVSLTQALDVDSGIGYGFSLKHGSGSHEFIKGLTTNSEVKGMYKSISVVQEFLTTKLLNLDSKSNSILELTETDISELQILKGMVHDNSDKFIMGSLMKTNGKLDPKNYVFELKSYGGTSAGNLIGRFSSQNEEINKLLKNIIEVEESFDPDSIFAEIVHVPHPRIGNVIYRSSFRKYEIPYISKSGVDIDFQIPITDLMISVRNGEIVLRSIKHNKRIIPCLTVAHNFSQGSLPIYKFLCDLQLQFKSSFNFDWGANSGIEFLPRVIYKNIIISTKKWILNHEKINYLLTDESNLINRIREWKKKALIPDLVSLKEDDHELLIDFNNDHFIEILIQKIKKRQELVFKEFLQNNENCIVRDEFDNGVCSETIIPLKKNKANTRVVLKNQYVRKSNNIPPEKRTFGPNSEWLYFKVYGGNKNLEEILLIMLLIIKQPDFINLFKNFYYIRYHDTDPHLRIRFYNDDITLLKELKSKFLEVLKPYIDNEYIFKIQIDTYERELERYGSHIIDLTEQLFNFDSFTVLEFISILQGNPEKYRWIFAMRSIDQYFFDFGYDLDEKYKIIKTISDGFFNEFGGSKILQKQLNQRYRSNQKFITTHMDSNLDIENEVEEIGKLLKSRSSQISAIITEIKSKTSKEELDSKIHSYLHMFMNRLFIREQRKCELVVNHYLERYYYSQLSIKKRYDSK